jgi:hypothetical protein
MAVEELRSLERRLREILGEQHARTLMEHLPRADLATKADLLSLEQRMDLKLESLEHRLLAAFRSELMYQTRTFTIGMVGSIATVGALAVAAGVLG